MDITSISGASAFQQNKTATSVASAVAAKVLDSERTQGAAVLKLLALAAPLPVSPKGSSQGLDVRG